MGEWSLPMDGGCRCGKVRFRIDGPPLLTMVCHCRGCQRMTASAYSTTVMAWSDSFAVIKGEPEIGGLHADRSRHHCGWCKSWLFTQIEPQMGFVNVRATMLDDPAWFVPFIENYLGEALPWARVPAMRSYARFPPKEDYRELLAKFAESMQES